MMDTAQRFSIINRYPFTALGASPFPTSSRHSVHLEGCRVLESVRQRMSNSTGTETMDGDIEDGLTVEKVRDEIRFQTRVKFCRVCGADAALTEGTGDV